MIQCSEGLDADFLDLLHPDVRNMVGKFDAFMHAWFGGSLAPLTRVTCVGRTEEASESIYLPIALKILQSQTALSTRDHAIYGQIQHLSPVGLRQWARLKPSWHKPFAAVDLGASHYTPNQLAAAQDFIHKNCEQPLWEIITENHGTGPHLHIARRDYGWLKDFPGSLRRVHPRKSVKNPQP